MPTPKARAARRYRKMPAHWDGYRIGDDVTAVSPRSACGLYLSRNCKCRVADGPWAGVWGVTCRACLRVGAAEIRGEA